MQFDIGIFRPTQSLIVVAALVVASVLAMAALQAHPRDGAQVAAVFSPWTDGGGAIARVAQAGGLVVRRGIFDTIVVVQSDQPGLIARLYAAGAWLVIDPATLGGCLAGRSDFHG
jgi:hypothetical protein